MKIEYNNLYTHFVFTTYNRLPILAEKNRVRIEKYITGIVNHNSSKLYAIYANPEHVHFLVSRSPSISEEELATVIADSSEKFINENNFVKGRFKWQQSISTTVSQFPSNSNKLLPINAISFLIFHFISKLRFQHN